MNDFVNMIYEVILWGWYMVRCLAPLIILSALFWTAIMMWLGIIEVTYITSVSDGRPALGIIVYPTPDAFSTIVSTLKKL